MERDFAKLVGAFTKGGLGVQNDDSLGKLGLVAAVSTSPAIVVTITDKGREALGLPVKPSRLPAEAAAADGGQEDSYIPTDGDSRESAYREIKVRRGQRDFRDALRRRYGDVCLISGCGELDVLEAAHIKPYRGQPDNHVENGLLLRADLHTLFDLDKIGIEPERLEVSVHPSIADPLYRELDGQTLRCDATRPSRDALQIRWEQYLARA